MNELKYRNAAQAVYDAVRDSDDTGDNVLWWVAFPPHVRRLIVETAMKQVKH